MPNWKKLRLNLTEVFRSTEELVQYVRGRKEVMSDAPKGDGHPVLVIPGFASSDIITKVLRDAIGDAGYTVSGWENGINYGFNDGKALGIYEKLKEVYEASGGQKVSLVGWSLGGIYARELAREYPDMVRDATSIFTPFGIGAHEDASPDLLVKTIKGLSDPQYSLDTEGMKERLLTPPPGIPTTSIYSKADAIGGWEACLNPKSPLAENVKVHGSHVGATWNLEVLAVVLDRLAQPEGEWKPYSLPEAPHAPDPDPSWEHTAGKWRFFPKR